MFRLLMALTLGGSLAIAPVAEAATKAEIKAQKATVKGLAKDLKSFQKLVAKWEKARESGKDTEVMDLELTEIAKAELAWLRNGGMPTEESKMEEGQAEKNPWMTKMRDAAVGVRDEKNTVDKLKALETLEETMQTRLDRNRRRLDKMEG